MKILFARHGESLANTLHIISNRDLPHPLTENGRAQAEALAQKIIGAGPEPASLAGIYASPVPRARQVAEIVAARLGGLVVISDGLREYDCGVLEGRGDVDAWKEHNRFFHDWLEGRRREQTPTGGESFHQIRERLAGLVNDLVNQYQPESCAKFLCVSHGGTLRLGLPGLLSNIDYEFVQTHSLSYTDIVEAETRDGTLVCRAWGEYRF